MPEDTLFQYVEGNEGNNGSKNYENSSSTTVTILKDGSWTYLRIQPGINWKVEDQGKMSEKQISKFTSLVKEDTLKIKMDDSLIIMCKPSGPDENYVSYRFYSSKIEAKFDSCFYGGNRDQDLFKQTELVLEAIWEEISVPNIK